ncbi:MAG: hypothetical protein SWH68_02520 [Thermodesulfobacteriota bacterium]|nr:hypothetical protein [Thermodesulfobacteriota bacterium]
MVYSPVHKFEISDISNEAERIDLLLFLEQLGVKHDIAPKTVRALAEEFSQQGLGPADAAHLAFAEATKADFISCDDKLIKKCSKMALNVWAGNPVAFCDKEDLR